MNTDVHGREVSIACGRMVVQQQRCVVVAVAGGAVSVAKDGRAGR